MTFNREIEDAIQFYRCHSCPDTWARAFINNYGGISSIDYTNWSGVNKTTFVANMAKIAGKIIRGEK